jgi:hypothetical protein
MISPANAHRPVRLSLDAIMLGAGLLLLGIVLAASGASQESSGENLTRNTIRLALAWYAAALILMLQLAPCDWAAATARGKTARWCWTWGLGCFLVHLAMAFHYYHGWSHADAFRHTREVSGWGEGIFASYLFTWLWLGDVAWWWRRPEAYAARPTWINRSLHIFMLFIAFNGMVVFGSGAIRWAGIAMFAVLGAAWFRARRNATRFVR